jgi:hypothetical protein
MKVAHAKLRKKRNQRLLAVWAADCSEVSPHQIEWQETRLSFLPVTFSGY